MFQRILETLAVLAVVAGLFAVLYGWMVPAEYQKAFITSAIPAIVIMCGAMLVRRQA